MPGKTPYGAFDQLGLLTRNTDDLDSYIKFKEQLKYRQLEQEKKENKIQKIKDITRSTIKYVTVTAVLFGTMATIDAIIPHRKSTPNPTAVCIEEKLRNTEQPVYSETESDISLWNLDGKGQYGDFDIEAITTISEPIKVLKYEKNFLRQIKEKNWIIDENSKEFTPYEKWRAEHVANEQLFDECLSKTK